VSGIREVYVWMLSQIGTAIDHPKIAAAQIILAKRTRQDVARRKVQEILERELVNITNLTRELAEGKYPVV